MQIEQPVRKAFTIAVLSVATAAVLVHQCDAAPRLPVTGESVAGTNAGAKAVSPSKPFVATAVAQFDQPWALAFLADGRLLVTERPGRLFLVSQDGRKREVSGVPSVSTSIQNGFLDVAVSPAFDDDRFVYFTYSERQPGGFVLMRAHLDEAGQNARLAAAQIVWHQSPRGNGYLWGGVIAFDPAGQHLFLAVRDSSRLSTDPSGAQDPDRDLGKVLRLNLDGSTPVDNPMAASGGVRAQVWTMGHRTAYGLAFAPDGKLWQHGMGPEGGDEFDLLEPGANYGWPIVSNGNDYGGPPIARHDTRPEFRAPALYWNPVIAPAGLAFYSGDLFPAWRGSALITGMVSQVLVRVTVDPNGQAQQADRWDMGARIRDVAVAPDGAVWLIEDGSAGRLLRLTPS